MNIISEYLIVFIQSYMSLYGHYLVRFSKCWMIRIFRHRIENEENKSPLINCVYGPVFSQFKTNLFHLSLLLMCYTLKNEIYNYYWQADVHILTIMIIIIYRLVWMDGWMDGYTWMKQFLYSMVYCVINAS